MHKKTFTKNPLNFFLLKVTTFHIDSVKNESARTKKTTAFLGLRYLNYIELNSTFTTCNQGMISFK